MLLDIRSEYGYVLLVAAIGAFIHNLWMPLKVMSARKKYNVRYPDLYATKENCDNEENIKAFNCVQRGHQNSLETLPTFYGLLMFSGLQYPIVASLCGVVYLVGRVVYFQGYSTGIPKYRKRGTFSTFGIFALLGCTLKFALDLLFSNT